MDEQTRSLYQLLAQLLEYPTETLPQTAMAGRGTLAAANAPVARALAGFSAYVDSEPLAGVQEAYTATFDLQGTCCPYVGHHLFGESYQRSWFMAQLSGAYRERGFDPGSELPDHVAVILRFLAQGHADEFSLVLLHEGLIPAVDKMLQVLAGKSHNPYGQVLAALQLVLAPENELENRGMIELKEGEVANG